MEILIKFVDSSCIAVCITLMVNAVLEGRRNNHEIISYLNSLLSELRVVKSLIHLRKENLSQNISDDNGGYSLSYVPISYNYLTIYEASAYKIGMIKNKYLVDAIICNYTDIKGLFESLKDLEKLAKDAHNYGLMNSDGKYNLYLAGLHKRNSQYIVNELMPNIEHNIEQLLIEIEKEIRVYEKKHF